MLRIISVLSLLLLTAQLARGEQLEHWHQVVRETPYWASQGAHRNLVTIRRWVLTGQSFCEEKHRHILFDRRGAFLGYIRNSEAVAQTQQSLNDLRQQLAQAGKVEFWVAGDSHKIGYPFALSCDQPDAQLDIALARYQGETASARLWGTWDGMTVGSENALVSLHQAIELVYGDRRRQGRISLPPDVLNTLAGKALIESGGRAAAHSAADARGIMQLSPGALRDCGLSEEFHFHRLAQIDCALRLLEQNHRNLKPVFDETFGHLPDRKAGQLYAKLLVQAYHGGVGRVSGLLRDDPAAAYFARYHERFSAGDIALGLVFHNLGRHELGLASLYYVTDVTIASEAACLATGGMPGC